MLEVIASGEHFSSLHLHPFLSPCIIPPHLDFRRLQIAFRLADQRLSPRDSSRLDHAIDSRSSRILQLIPRCPFRKMRDARAPCVKSSVPSFRQCHSHGNALFCIISASLERLPSASIRLSIYRILSQ
jgi:hypothetical protein